MHRRIRHALAATGALVALAGAAGPASAATTHARNGLFVQTNDPAGNAVVAFHRTADGSLRRDATYATGGLGATAEGSPGDTLATQGGLAYDRRHGLLLAVNAGSASVSVFSADGDVLTLRQVVDSGGPFPASIAVHGGLVYVLDAGGSGTVQGYRVHGRKLSPIRGSARDLGLSNTTPPNFLSSPGQVGFAPGGHQLIVTTKTNQTIDVFSVNENGRLSQAPTVNHSAAPVPFAFAFDAEGHMIVAEAAASSTASSYALNGDGSLTGLDLMVPDGQPAACWIVRARGFLYVSNTGNSTISAYTSAPDGSISLAVTPDGIVASTGGGSIDLAVSADERYLYVQNTAAGSVQEYAVADDGTLTLVATATGLPAFDGDSGMEGLVAV